MSIALHPDETRLREGAANLQRGIETVGGRLFLTEQRLLFSAHGFNVQTGSTDIALSDIRQLRPCWTKLLNVIPIFPNSLAVETTDGRSYRFVLYGRSQWAEAIEAQRRRAPVAPLVTAT